LIHVVKMTREQKIEMYMKNCKKRQLAEMLAACNEISENRSVVGIFEDGMFEDGDIKKFDLKNGSVMTTGKC